MERLIKPSGAILSSMGGRVPMQSMLDMADSAGYSGRIVSLAWKIQSEPETVIGEYAENQKRGANKVSCYISNISFLLINRCSTISIPRRP